MRDIDNLEELSPKDVAVKGTTGVSERGFVRLEGEKGTKKVYDTGVITSIGNVKSSIWTTLAECVIDNDPEAKAALAAIEQYYELHGSSFMKKDARSRHETALKLCTSGEYNDKSWTGYRFVSAALGNR